MAPRQKACTSSFRKANPVTRFSLLLHTRIPFPLFSARTGIPYNYWSQYLSSGSVLLQIGGASVGVGFAVALFSLFAKISIEGTHDVVNVAVGSLVGALLISGVTLCSLVTTVGLSTLAG